jgi:hypothetical protein
MELALRAAALGALANKNENGAATSREAEGGPSSSSMVFLPT